MTKTKQSPQNSNDPMVKFLLLMAIGLILPLLFTFRIEWGGENWLTIEWFEPGYLELTMAGVGGGLLNSVYVEKDKALEFPSWVKDEKKEIIGFKPGFVGDMFVGIAGAFIAYIALSQFFSNNQGPSWGFEIVKIWLVGFVGGFGGEYLMKAVLKRLVEQIREGETIKKRLAELEEVETIQELASRQIDSGLNPQELNDLVIRLENSSIDPQLDPVIKEGIFDNARNARRLGTRVKNYSDRIYRTIPVFEALVTSEPENDRYLAQLACAYRDIQPPRLDAALKRFNQAIKLRNQTNQQTSTITRDNWRYELDRVVALIEKFTKQGLTNGANSTLSSQIINDLITINQNYGLKLVFQEFDLSKTKPIKKWLTSNQTWLKSSYPEIATILTLIPDILTDTKPTRSTALNTILPSTLKRTISTRTSSDRFNPKVSTTQSTITRTTIKPERWDKALKKSFSITTGASPKTARQDGLRYSGVRASQTMAKTDWPKIEKYAERFYQAAVKYDVPPAIIAAICSRESRGGTALAADGTGDGGRAFGLMQVDQRYWQQQGRSGDPGSQIHINQGTMIYAQFREQIRKQHPTWTDEYLLKGAAVAYNSGPDNVRTKAGMDRGTTGNDYGSDVIARAKYYTQKLQSLAECKGETETDLTTVNGSEPSENLASETKSDQMQKITAIRDTVLKKQPEQSSLLSPSLQKAVASGQSYDVEKYKAVGDGHYWVKLAYGAGEWYIYDGDLDGHWQTSWEGDEEDTETTVEPNQGVGEIHNTPGQINWHDGNLRISKYFTVGEVTKNDPRRIPKPNSAEERNILKLAKELDKIRADWGSAIRVTSWYRPPVVNREQGGVSNSQHINGRAVDVQPIGKSIYDFQKYLDRSWYGHLGYGAKRGFVHLDIRNGQGWKTGGTKGGRFPY